MKNLIKFLMVSLLATITTLMGVTPAVAAHGGGGGQQGGFTFSYTITNTPETVVTNIVLVTNVDVIVTNYVVITNAAQFPTNYHVYNVVSQVNCGGTNQPAGTVVLGVWWVQDLGPAFGTGSVVCTTPICPTGKSASTAGFLLFADARDVGGDGLNEPVFTHPVADIEQFFPNWYGGADFVGMIEPDGSGITLYFGVRLLPFYWNLSPYVL